MTFEEMYESAEKDAAYQRERADILEGELALCKRQVEALASAYDEVSTREMCEFACPAKDDSCSNGCAKSISNWSLEQAKKGSK